MVLQKSKCSFFVIFVLDTKRDRKETEENMKIEISKLIMSFHCTYSFLYYPREFLPCTYEVIGYPEANGLYLFKLLY